jgi:putative endonuclease
MIILYVINSIGDNFRYTGITNNLRRRLSQHNNGLNKSTQPYRPFELILSEKYKTYKEARKREVFLKSGVGRKFLDNLNL